MICRLCLTVLNLENSVSLFNEFNSEDDPQLLTIIAKHLHMKITWDDEDSTTICRECCNQLSEFEKYCVFIREQQIKLNQKVLEFKREPNEDVTKQIQLQCDPHKYIVTNEIEMQFVPDKDIATKEIQPQCDPYEDIVKNEIEIECVPDDDIATDEIQLQCVPDEDVLTNEMQLQCESHVEKDLEHQYECSANLQLKPHSLPKSSVIYSTTSSFFKPSSSSFFLQAYTEYIDSSTRNSLESDKRVEPIPDATSIKKMLLQCVPEEDIIINEMPLQSESDKDVVDDLRLNLHSLLQSSVISSDTSNCSTSSRKYKSRKDVQPTQNAITCKKYRERKKATTQNFKVQNDSWNINININVTPVIKKIPIPAAERSRRSRARKKEITQTQKKNFSTVINE